MNRQRILLIEPPFYRLMKETYSLVRYPLSLGYLASAVKKRTDWEVLVHNADFSPASDAFEVTYLTGEGFSNYLHNLRDPSGYVWQEVQDVVATYAPAVVGISAKSANFASARVVARLVKEVDARTLVVMGGPHPSAVASEALAYPEVEVCVVGEGEATLVDVLHVLDRGAELADVQGIVYRTPRRLVSTPRRDPISDLDSLGFPNHFAAEVLNHHQQYPLHAFRSVFATRGCPNNCFFCGSREVWGRRVRFRSPHNVVQEIRSLQSKGLEHIHFDDDTFGVHPRYLRALCEEIATHCPGLRWSCEIHVNLVSDENVSLMKQAGCVSIQLGIESGSDRVLRAIRKGYTIAEAMRACEIVKGHDIGLEAFFMVGFPQETEATLGDTLRAIERIDCDKTIYSIFTPYPGTEAYAYCKEKGLIGEGYDPSLYNHQSPANCFCTALSPKRFRSLAAHIEQVVDDKNRQGRR
jgi:anaerobic magnesium-protoporphyrin IX monomethyl ester cyclase